MTTAATTTKSTTTKPATAEPTTNQQQQQQQKQQDQDPAGPQQQHLHLNWSNFKPEFSGEPDEDAEVHLLCSNDWRNAHHFCQWCEGSKILSHIIRGSKTMVPFPGTHKCRLAQITKFVQTKIFKGR